ncbi:ShlB/FhaC/HecB family hemolysin secretion/activation protein [Iodobacter sp. CM08]|uniref:ShlB/FhaC/HecB family hemolysin secretion/activation protein n=1 Tax=Iodobacter sp. CM08 TaxID=3085902 RepID=UPI002981531A|nr:ShlB/FhaC/HecB family hemolysin secretion/activation protein [Iodobacter sp. CM08]MDW5416936.1 ShlB/FhaC/HecB family hemolysin secretion/activation protein [Iodobacter sp. CM08]
MTKTQRTLLSALLASISLASAAADIKPDLPIMQQSMEDQSRRLMQENANRFRSIVDDQRMRQLKNDDSALPAHPASSMQEFDCLAIKGLKLAGIELLSHAEVNALGLPSAECLSNQDINRFIQALTTLYVQKGYIAVRILASGPDADGVLTLRAIEGHVEAIQSADRRLNTGTLFPDVIGQPLNIKDIDQGLDQANRLQSNHATVDILPGAAQGGSILMLRNPESPPWHGGVSLNDSGQESTGEWIAGINASWDSPFAASDFISLSTQSTTDNPNTRYSRSSSLFYSLPYGYWTLSAFASESRYLNTQQLDVYAVQLSGESSQSGVRLDRVIARSQHATSTASVQLSHKRSDNYFLDGWLGISSPKLTVMELGFNQMLIGDSGIWVLDASLEKGLTWFGADHDKPIADWPRPEFTKAKLGIKLYRNFVIAEQAISLQSSWSWQGSRDRLPAIEQVELASQSAVHGFKRNSLSGDTGWYWRNTLSARLPLLGAFLSPRIGIDAGRVLQANLGYQSLAGMTLGLSFNMQDFNIDLEYNRALHMPDKFTNEEGQIISRLSWQF